MTEERRAPVQGEGVGRDRIPAGTIAWSEHEEVYQAYAKRYRMSAAQQDAECIADRCGFGKSEAEKLLGRPLATWKAAS